MIALVLLVSIGCVFGTPVDVSNRIIGGSDASAGQFPFIASLRWIDEEGDKNHFCGGSIINERWILTAAHCFLNFNEKFEVMVGSIDQENPGDIYEVEKFFWNKDYSTASKHNDVALVKTKTAIKLGKNVSKIEMADVTPGDDVIMAGWGLTRYPIGPGGEGITDILQFIPLKTLDNKDCKGLPPQMPITSTQVCTKGEKGKGLCQADSGGPLVKKVDGSWKLVGVVSFGMPCAKGLPDVYSRATSFQKWVTDNAK